MSRTATVSLIVLLLSCAITDRVAGREDGSPAAERPNVVIIFTDDQGYRDVGAFGATEFETPNLDRMAREGMRFTDFYVAAPVCSPSRAALLTGCYPPRVGITGVLFPRHRIGLDPSTVTIADLLRGRGYATACVGKWHLGHHPAFLPTRHGFDRYFGVPYSNDMDPVKGGDRNLDRAWEKNSHAGWNVPLMRDETIIERPADQRTLTQRYTGEAIRFIRENRDRPFFLYLAHTMPHIPLFVADRFRGASGAGPYGDTIEEIDWSTGEILAAIRDAGLDERTLVVFTSDNGPWLGKGRRHAGSALPLRSGKFTVYEGGMRVPCIMRWPGRIPAGRECRELAATIDLLPTIARLAGARIPDDSVIDGKDIWPLMAGADGATTPHEAYFFYRGDRLRAVRSGDWKLHLAGRDGGRAKQKRKRAGAAAELYDLGEDIGETRNLASSEPGVVRRLTALALGFHAALAAGARPPGKIDREGPFQANGFKVGEVTDTTAVVWTRLTRRPERNPPDGPMVNVIMEEPEKDGEKKSGSRRRKVIGVEYPDGATVADIRDAAPGVDGFVRVLYRAPGADAWLRTAWHRVDPERDFIRQITLRGLRPGTRYELRVESSHDGEAATGQTIDGRFSTAPAPADADRVVFTVSTGQAYGDRDGPHGYDIYPSMLELDPHFFVHTGDIVYYDRLAKTPALARYHWQRTYGLPTNVEFHRRVASYFIKDDHDVWLNDCWPSQKTDFMYQFTFAQGQAIFREQVPMGERTYRTRRWGRDLQVWLVEGRDFRSANTDPDGPEKTIWGEEQKAWFKRTVSASNASFRVLISPTPIVGPDRTNKNDNHSNAGFKHEGDELRRFLASEGVYVICGDRHWQYASVDPATGVREYSCGPASDSHAGGWRQSDFRREIHRYLNVTGGFLSATVERVDDVPRMTVRYHDSRGRTLFEDVRLAGSDVPPAEVVIGAGDDDAATPSPLHRPFGVDFDAAGNMYIVELEGGRVHRRDAVSGEVTTIAGSSDKGHGGDGGPAARATFNGMHNVAVTPDGDVYIADSWNHCVRRIDGRTGIITTAFGTGEEGFSGDGGPASEARFNYVMCITLSPAGDALHVADLRNRRVRTIDLASGIVTTIAGNGERGVPEDGAMAVESPLVDPRAVAADSKGNVYVLERGGHALRVVAPDGAIRTVVNASGEPGDDDGPALMARLRSPKHIAVDSEDCVVIADDQNGLIRRYDPRIERVTTLLGRGDGIELRSPHGVCFEQGKLFVVDTGNDRILRVYSR